jgi:hypothetical protein
VAVSIVAKADAGRDESCFWSPGYPSNLFEDLLLCHVLVRSNTGKNRVERADSQGIMRRNSHTVGSRLFGLQDGVAPCLMNSLVAPAIAEVFDQVLTAQTARQLHATASTSSRTSRRRIEAGGAESK